MDVFSRTRPKSGKIIVWIHPVTGEPRFPASDEMEMPLRYKIQGYEVKEFTSYLEHQSWMRSKGLVNHVAEGVHNDDDILPVNRWGY